MTDLRNLSVEELASLISPGGEIMRELRSRGVLETRNTVGELGEYYAVEFYKKTADKPKLVKAPPGVQNVDALGRNGLRYSIKTVSKRSGTTGSFWNPESIDRGEQTFDFLIIVILDDNWRTDMILELTWDAFIEHKKFNKRMQNYNISLTQKLIDHVNVIFDANS
jgi:hypothetical protein